MAIELRAATYSLFGKHAMDSVVRCTVVLMATLVLVCRLGGQETCGKEVKLLLSPAQVQAVVPALNARGKTHRRIYFYDTSGLDLLAQGVILRLRVGEEIDLTAKLRPSSRQSLLGQSGGRQGYECEVDVNDGAATRSFSVQSKIVAATVPKTGEELFQLLNERQKQLLKDSKVPIDWRRIKRVAEIESTVWKTHATPPLGKLSLELWEWPSGSILEVSTKMGPDGGQSTYVDLRNLANKDGLVLSTNQSSKTAIALQSMATTQAR